MVYNKVKNKVTLHLFLGRVFPHMEAIKGPIMSKFYVVPMSCVTRLLY